MFSKAKIGDRVWDFLYQYGTIDELKENTILVKFDSGITVAYNLNGSSGYPVNVQTLFWNKIEFEIPKKPFNLKDFLKDNLEPKEFEHDGYNYFFYWDCAKEKFCYVYSTNNQYIQLYFSENIKEVVKILNKNKIKFHQLKQAFKELQWI